MAASQLNQSPILGQLVCFQIYYFKQLCTKYPSSCIYVYIHDDFGHSAF